MTRPALVALVLAALPAAAAEPTVHRSHGIAMHGEPALAADFAHLPYVNPDAPKGGTLKLGAMGTFDSLNPFIIKGTPAALLGRTYDTLMVNSADEPFTEYCLLCDTVEWPDDRSWVRFHLRDDARWHDGEPVTADDVVFSFNILREQGDPFYRYYYKSVDQVEKLDEDTVQFTFTEGENRELPLIIGQLPILPEHYWAERDFTASTLEPPLTSGPYRVARVDPGRAITIERVPDYWAADHPVRRGRDNFDKITADYYRDATVIIEALKGGNLSLRAENSAKDWATAYDIPALENGELIKGAFPHDRPAGMQGFVFNLRKPMFQDPAVRQALAYAFDFPWSNRVLFHGQYQRTRSYFDNSELAATGLPEGAELAILEEFRDQLPPEVFTTEYQPPTTDGSGNIRANLRQASKILNDAGWVIRDGKRVNAETGEPLAFEILLVSPAMERVTLPFADNLKRLGIDASVRTVDATQYQARAESFDYDMMVNVWGQSDSPGNEQREFWGSAAADTPGSRNYAGIKDPVVDALIAKVIAAPDRDSLVQRVRALDRVLQWGHYVIPQFHLDYDRLVYWDVFGMPEDTPTSGVQTDTWWIDPAKAERLKGRLGAVTGN